ncbi:hypothetical protein AWB82_07132 [Caballeronia glebae]|uniref:Uncharacterized protein n=1 Tax=Caballeronia glebae TaxID=1777143 RepID=A0A158DSE6_9BURK|nr:hypothetical protein AWB82_07132 [Caballeronia glebae]
MLLRFVIRVVGRADRDRLAGQTHVLPRVQRAIHHVQGVGRLDVQIAIERADHAAIVGHGARLLFVCLRARADGHREGAIAHQPRLALMVIARPALGVLRGRHRDVIRRRQIHVVLANDRCALDRQIVARLDVHGIARYRAAHADIRLRVLHLVGRGAVHDATALGMPIRVIVVLLAPIVERHIARSHDIRRAGIGPERRARERHVSATLVRAHSGERRVAARGEGRAFRLFVVAVLDKLVAIVRGNVVELPAIGDCGCRQVATRHDRHVLARAHLRTLEGHVVARLHRETAARADAARLIQRRVLFPMVIGVFRHRLRSRRLNGIHEHVMTRRDLRVAARADARAMHRQIVPRGHDHIARRYDRALRTDQRLLNLAVARRRTHAHRIDERRVDDVVPRQHRHAIARDAPRCVQQIVRCGNDRRAIAADAAAAIENVRAGDHRLRATFDHAAIRHTAGGMNLHIVSRDQCASRLKIVGVRLRQIHHGCEHMLCGAIGQRDQLIHQPHDVARERVHLRRRQCHARHEIERLSIIHAARHQRTVFVFGGRVALQIHPARQLRDLVADELLLIQTVAQALLGLHRIEVQRVEHVVAGDEARVARQTRIGCDQIRRVRSRVVVVQAAGGQRDGQRPGRTGHRLRGVDRLGVARDRARRRTVRGIDRGAARGRACCIAARGIHPGAARGRTRCIAACGIHGCAARHAHAISTAARDLRHRGIRTKRAARRARGRTGRRDVRVVHLACVDVDQIVRDDRTTRAADGHRSQHDRRLRDRAHVTVLVLVPRIGRDDILPLILIQRLADVVDDRAAHIAVAARIEFAVLRGIADADCITRRDGAVRVVDDAHVRQRHRASGEQLGLRRLRTRHPVPLRRRGRVTRDFHALPAVVCVAARQILRGRVVVDVRIVGVPVVDRDRTVAVFRERVVVDRRGRTVDVDDEHAIHGSRPARARLNIGGAETHI